MAGGVAQCHDSALGMWLNRLPDDRAATPHSLPARGGAPPPCPEAIIPLKREQGLTAVPHSPQPLMDLDASTLWPHHPQNIPSKQEQRTLPGRPGPWLFTPITLPAQLCFWDPGGQRLPGPLTHPSWHVAHRALASQISQSSSNQTDRRTGWTSALQTPKQWLAPGSRAKAGERPKFSWGGKAGLPLSQLTRSSPCFTALMLLRPPYCHWRLSINSPELF